MSSLSRYRFFSILVLLIALGWSGCSTKKNTLVSRSYHRLTARYNGYYWAREAIKEGLDKLDKAHVDDYGKILSFYRYADEKTAKGASVYWDKAINKTSTVIAKHSMNIKGSEKNKWIDENYLVLGQGHYYKRDYYSAIEVFEYIVKQYKNTPTKYLALIWLIKTYNAQNSVINTQATIDLIENDKNFPKKYEGLFETVKAEYLVLTENYEKAIPVLTKAITLTKNKKQRARLTFILAQLYEQSGDVKKASNYYAQVSRLNPPYELFFNAKIKRALTVTGNDSKTVKKELAKMAKDEKNIEYLDQIYFALAEIALKETDTTTAIKLLKKSAEKSMSNNRQHALSYLRLADIYFVDRDYKNAQAYYDSTMAFLPKDYKDYALIQNKKTSLTSLIKNVNIIYMEDSLLRVSKMDTARINKMIDAMISRLVEEEKKKEEEKQNLQTGPNWFNNNTNPNNTTNSGAWYFYNPAQLALGQSDFLKKWGQRELEDNWRRSNKETVIPDIDENPEVKVKDTLDKKVKLADNKTRAYYLKDIPFSEEQKTKSTEKIVEAYYALGGIYKEQLNDLPRAIQSLEELNKRFPDNKYALTSYYALYRMNLQLKNQPRADYYKNIILTKYPDSEPAKLLLNPDIYKDLKAKQGEIEKMYNETYRAYQEGRYADVLAFCRRADSLYAKSEIMPKFALLRAFAIGKTSTPKEYENALQRIIVKYPKDPAKNKAQELLDAMKKMKLQPDSIMKKDSVVKQIFALDKNAEHYYMIVINAKKVDMNQLKTNVSDFNQEYFSLANLNIISYVYDKETQVLIVKSFNGAQKALDYYQLITGDAKAFKNIDAKETRGVVISDQNYQTVFKDKKKEEYFQFFQENYLKKNP